MGADFSQGRLGALGLQAALREPSGRGGPKAALAEGLWTPGAGQALQPMQGNGRQPPPHPHPEQKCTGGRGCNKNSVSVEFIEFSLNTAIDPLALFTQGLRQIKVNG